MGTAYRVRQFFAALRPRVDPVERSLVVVRLTPAERALFARLTAAYQRHSLGVLRRLEAAGYTDADLLRAALLHDVGKAEAGIGLHHRVLAVLLPRFAPTLWGRLVSEEAATGWRRPFYVQRHHAALGARLAQAAGASARTVALIARHHDPAAADDEELRALRRADGSE